MRNLRKSSLQLKLSHLMCENSYEVKEHCVLQTCIHINEYELMNGRL